MLLQEFLEKSAERLPDKTALICGDQRLTFAEVESCANKLAHTLRESGVRYHDRVAVMAHNCAEAVISIWGILKADATFIVINHTTKSAKVEYILNNCRARALVTHALRWKNIAEAIQNVPSLGSVIVIGNIEDGMKQSVPKSVSFMGWNDAIAFSDNSPPDRRAIDIDLAALIYTSGTTGNPKGVMLTHLNMVSASTSITTYLENTEDDIILNVLPMSFDYGLYQILMASQFGGTVVLEKSFALPYHTINLLREEKATGFPLVPTMSAMLMQLKELEDEEFPSLRYLTNTAAALPVNHIRGLQAIFPGAAIYSMYGLTECKRVSYLPPAELGRRPTSVGKGMPNEEVYLVDESGERITEPGAPGELVVRGSNVMQGYWENPDATAEMLKPGSTPQEKVLYTGDLFKMDEEGFLYFISRKDDIIKSRGEKVSPKEVENVLYSIEGVVAAAVIGVPDDLLGEAVKGFVVLSEESKLTETEILARCSASLEDFMVPAEIDIRDSLPMTTSGKITKKDLN